MGQPAAPRGAAPRGESNSPAGAIPGNKPLGIIPPIVFNGLIVGGYLPFLLVDPGSTVTVQAIGISMLSVAGSEAVLLVVLGLPLIAVIAKTKIKDLL